jgi:hypothetical protein
MHAPRILSTPLQPWPRPASSTSTPALAVDADVGDTLTWNIGDGPSGMTVDAQGIVRWTPTVGDAGPNTVVLQVSDQGGQSGFQFFTIEVQDPIVVPDVGGLTEAQASMQFLWPASSSTRCFAPSVTRSPKARSSARIRAQARNLPPVDRSKS